MVEIGCDETLQVALSLDAGVEAGAILITFGDILDGSFDVAILCHHIVLVGKMVVVDL